MKDFRNASALARLSLDARLAYGGFCIFMALGTVTCVWLYSDSGLGLSATSARAYIDGDEESAHAVPALGHDADTGAGGGLDLSALDLPANEAAAAPLHLPKPERQLWETFHFHIFSLPIVLLIISHIFMMCALKPRFKSGVIVAAHIATLVHLGAPLLIRHGLPGAAWLMGGSALLMALTWLLMTLRPLWEMLRTPLPRAVF